MTRYVLFSLFLAVLLQGSTKLEDTATGLCPQIGQRG